MFWTNNQNWKLLHRNEVPDWLNHNEFILDGFRPQLKSLKLCLKSIFLIHTQTVNIWTHLLGIS
jgi:adiponectin receptor